MNQSIKKKTNKQINIRKSISFLMSMLMFLGMIPFSTGIAYAEEDRDAITSLSELKEKEYIYMGVQGSGLQGVGKEIKWRVLDKNANNGNPDGLFLLSEELLGSGNDGGVEYHKGFSFSKIEWKDSTAKKWCKEFSGEEPRAITSLKPEELAAVLSTDKSDGKYKSKGTTVVFPKADHILNGDKVFFLSAEEADKIYFESMDERKAKYNGEVKEWWLRSYSSSNPSIVNKNGEVNEGSAFYSKAARPAFNLEKSKVMYISPAKDGKNRDEVGALEKVPSTNTTEWKLTLKDSARGSFTASKSKQDGMEVTINYDNAKTGENEYLSAVVTNESNTEIKYYGRIKHLKEDSDKEGIAKIDLNGKFENGDKLFVFNEQYNGDKRTDYSSDWKEIQGINVKKFYDVILAVSPENVGVLSKYGVSHVAEDTAISAIDNVLTVGTEKVTATANTNTGYRFKDWTGIPKNGKVTGNITVTAVFESAPQPPQEKYTVTVKSNNETMGTVSKGKVENIAKDTMISKSGNELTVGTEKITATAKSGYRFKDWTGIPTNGTVTGNVAVTAVFEKKISGGKHSSDKDKDKRRYPIEKGKMNHGTITVESEGRYGEEITITAEPDRGYEVDKIKVTDDSGKDIEVTEKKGDKYTFSMPRRKVTVEATFKKIERPSNNNGQNPNDYMQKQKEVKTTVFTVGSNMVKYTVSGETQHASERQIDAKPFIRNGRVMVPIRYVAESLGMKVMWNKQSKIVTLQDKERKVEIVTNSKKIVVNGKEYVSDVAPVIENGRTYLSISNIGKVSGANMTWNNQSKQVSITK
ncbi:stalk domain-containing protein [Filifactor alocis]|uniref:stalk domain-containing protein n=1 Tax=Filifactor alocis TaxID=143361 RepID=UPI0028E2FC35|nr:stalk domain-containing protein [Filifactor alocis]